MDPLDSRRLYFGTQTLYRTDNSARNWTPIYETPDEAVITAIAPSAASPNTVYAAIRMGRIVATHDGGETWLEAGQAEGLPDRYIGGVAAHPTDPGQAYAAVGGFLSGHVYHTADGGHSWQDRTGNLPDHPVNSIIYDPADPDGVYLATDFGVFHSPTGDGTWTRLQDGLPVSAVYDVAAQPGTGRLVAATHGRGMFELPIEVPLSARVRPASITDTAIVASQRRIIGDVIVAPHGQGDYSAAWTGSSDSSWVLLPGAAGRGRGRFDYQLSTAELPSGDHEAAIDISVAGVAEPVSIPVHLHIPLASHLALEPGEPPRSVLVGSTESFEDSVRVVFTGPRTGTRWTAEFGGRAVVAVGQRRGGGRWRGDLDGRSRRPGSGCLRGHGGRGGRVGLREPGHRAGQLPGEAAAWGDGTAHHGWLRDCGVDSGAPRLGGRRAVRFRSRTRAVDGRGGRIGVADDRAGRGGRTGRRSCGPAIPPR